MRPRIVGIVGGSVGSDPFGSRTWSGTSRSLFSAMRDRGVLAAAVGIAPPVLTRVALQLRHLHPNRSVWRRRYYSNIHLRNALTASARRRLRSIESGLDSLQVGAMFNARDAAPHLRRCYSYNDGNAAMAARAPYGSGLTAKQLESVLAYERRVAGSMDLVLTTSDYLRRSFISDLQVAPEKVVTVGAGVNLAQLPMTMPEKDFNSRELLFIGVEFQRKGGAVLLEAFNAVKAKFPDAQLHIVGPPRRRSTLLAAGIHWHGYVDRSKPEGAVLMAELFRRASLFVMPSLYEPFGLAPLEALAHSIPCVVTNDWALAETIQSGVNGELVAAGDPKALAQTIIGLLENPARLRVLGSVGPEWVRARFTWPVVVDRILTAIERL